MYAEHCAAALLMHIIWQAPGNLGVTPAKCGLRDEAVPTLY
jgi:hypothetical protein